MTALQRENVRVPQRKGVKVRQRVDVTARQREGVKVPQRKGVKVRHREDDGPAT